MTGSNVTKKYSHKWLECYLGKGRFKGCMLSVYEGDQEFFRITSSDRSTAKNYFIQIYPKLADEVFGGSNAFKR